MTDRRQLLPTLSVLWGGREERVWVYEFIDQFSGDHLFEGLFYEGPFATWCRGDAALYVVCGDVGLSQSRAQGCEGFVVADVEIFECSVGLCTTVGAEGGRNATVFLVCFEGVEVGLGRYAHWGTAVGARTYHLYN